MGIEQIPSPVAKTRFLTTLTSGTSWTVPAGVTYVNVTLRGGGGGTAYAIQGSQEANGGQVVSATLSVTPGGSVTYAIGAGGAGGTSGSPNGLDGGTTSFSAATALGGVGHGNPTGGGVSRAGTNYLTAGNGAFSSLASGTAAGAAGGAGSIDVEYWL